MRRNCSLMVIALIGALALAACSAQMQQMGGGEDLPTGIIQHGTDVGNPHGPTAGGGDILKGFSFEKNGFTFTSEQYFEVKDEQPLAVDFFNPLNSEIVHVIFERMPPRIGLTQSRPAQAKLTTSDDLVDYLNSGPDASGYTAVTPVVEGLALSAKKEEGSVLELVVVRPAGICVPALLARMKGATAEVDAIAVQVSPPEDDKCDKDDDNETPLRPAEHKNQFTQPADTAPARAMTVRPALGDDMHQATPKR